MTTLVRTDRVSGYTWVDFYVDQSEQWVETVTWWPGVEGVGLPVNVTGYTAQFTVTRTGLESLPVLDLTSPTEITVGGVAGTFSWDVPADVMADLTHPVYQHELTLFPNGDGDSAFPLLKGRVLVRADLVPLPAPPVVPGAGWGHGPWGHFPWGH